MHAERNSAEFLLFYKPLTLHYNMNMFEIKEEAEKKPRCLLIGAPPKQNEPPEPKELQGLVHTLGMEVADTVVLNRIEPTPSYPTQKYIPLG